MGKSPTPHLPSKPVVSSEAIDITNLEAMIKPSKSANQKRVFFPPFWMGDINVII